MIINGAYQRKTDDSTFSYTAKIHAEYGAFSAKVYDSHGRLVGTPLEFLSADVPYTEHECRKWIENCINKSNWIPQQRLL